MYFRDPFGTDSDKNTAHNEQELSITERYENTIEGLKSEIKSLKDKITSTPQTQETKKETKEDNKKETKKETKVDAKKKLRETPKRD